MGTSEEACRVSVYLLHDRCEARRERQVGFWPVLINNYAEPTETFAFESECKGLGWCKALIDSTLRDCLGKTNCVGLRHVVLVGGRPNQRLKRTGCKVGSASKKSREESALFGLGVAPVPAF